MNPSYESGPSFTTNPQRVSHQHQQHQHSSHKSPHSTSASHPEAMPASGRQRVRTEPSPRHQHTSSGWLGPYNEQPSPIPGVNSPRRPRLPGVHISSSGERGAGAGVGGRSAMSVSGSDRILDAHRTLGGWHMDGSSSSSSNSTNTAGATDGGFERRPFDPKQSDGSFTGPSMEPSNSLQSLVESIDDDHVFKLTEMTKKRVEHNNPAQKRQRVVSLSASETMSATDFQPSEKTHQFSTSCKSYLELRYSQLFQSINAGHPINRLRKLHEIVPQIKSLSVPRLTHDGKPSMDSSGSRSRRWKSDKYRFVDKVEESSCIWDLDHMEAKAAAEAAAEAAALAKQAALNREGSQPNLDQIVPATLTNLIHQRLQSTSTDSLTAGHSGESLAPTATTANESYYDSPLAAVDTQSVPTGMSPSSTFSSITSPNQTHESAINSFSSLEPNPQNPQKESSGENKLRFVEHHSPVQQALSAPAIKFSEGVNGHSVESAALDISPSKRNSFLGIFGVRGKKVGQDIDLASHAESPQSSAYGSPRLSATASTQERRSFDSQHSPYFQPTLAISQSQRSHLAGESAPPTLVHSYSGLTTASATSDGQSRGRTSIDDAARPGEYGEPGAVLTDDENGGHWATPTQWPQGERMEDSQDESDNPTTAANKRSSLRRFKDRMPWKRGNKALSAIHQGESTQNPSTTPGHSKPHILDGNKSFGRKIDPTLAYLQGQNFGRMSTSEPSSGRNSIDGSSRPKLNFRVLSSSSSPVLEAVKSPDGSIGVSSPRVGPIAGAMDMLGRSDRSPSVHPSRSDKSPTINPTSRPIEKSPLLNASKAEKSPLLMPTSMFVGEDVSGTTTPMHGELTKKVACALLVDVERIPKRLLQRLKQRPELGSIDWTEDTVDLSALWSSPEPLPTYEEHVGISDIMKMSNLYPSQLDDVDVLEIHLTLNIEEPEDIHAKNQARRWDLLELRVDQELDHGEKWMKEVFNWSRSKANVIDRHQQTESLKAGEAWHLDDHGPLVEEPETEDGTDESAPDAVSRDEDEGKSKQRLHIAPLETLKARKRQRELSLTSVRDLSSSMSSLQTSSFTFKSSLDTTREAVNEMRVYLEECRQRLQQLHEATGKQLQEKEPIFKEVVDKFTMEWNESYFVRLKEVEDQIQVMNLKRIENPWMDMLLIMLSWFIRGLFYIVEGVTIMIIIVRHAWGKAKKGYEVVRNTKREQERLSRDGGGSGGGTGRGEEKAEAMRGMNEATSPSTQNKEAQMNANRLGYDNDNYGQALAPPKCVGGW